MQIWESPYMFVFIQKQYLENFTFLILRILELFTREICKFLKSRLIFNLFYRFWMFINKLFTYLTCASLKAWKVFGGTLFSYEDEVLADFQIYISTPLKVY